MTLWRLAPGPLMLAAAITTLTPGCSSRTPGSAPASELRGKLRAVDKCDDPRMAPEDEYTVKPDLTYSTVNGQELKLDLLVPLKDGPHPVVLFIHGGAWTAGHRKDLIHETRMAVGMGFAGATVSYRLATSRPNIFPAAIQDVRCAIRFLRAKADDHKLDPRRVAVVGLSAGGHLAALTAAAGEDKRLDGECPHKAPVGVNGAAAYFAPLDLRPQMGPAVADPILSAFLGTSPVVRPDVATLASPVAHLSPGDPPFLVVHGKGDSTVPRQQSTAFKWTMDQMGIEGVHVELPGAAHGFYMFKGGPVYRKATCSTVAFLRAVLK